AGNRALDSDLGPLFPAAYEQRPRACGTESPAWAYQPLVHAVGAVDASDRPLGLSREGGTPRLVAPGALVLTPEDTAAGVPRPTAVLSGTSMSAAAVSGAAALLWSLRPGATGDMVMEALYQTGEALGRDAEFALPGEIQPQRRLAVARAFDLACPQNVAVGACPQGDARPALPAPRGAGLDAGVPFGDLVALLYEDVVLGAVAPGPPPPLEGGSAYLEPYVVPQPGTPNCIVCGIYENQLYGSLDPNLAGSYVGSPVLEFKNDQSQYVQIALNPLPEKDAFKVDLTSELKNDTLVSAWLIIPAQLNGQTVYTRSELDID
ncbi:MAG: S8 family serine peptidase, partial [Myxococcales bacterium]|nr:S8 family serine peptidase [Myxococcales bacterium]